MKRSAEFYLNSKHRQQLAAMLQDQALKYKQSFRVVETICDNNLSIPGAIAQVQGAYTKITEQRDIIETRHEVVTAAKDLLAMNQAIDRLNREGVPRLASLELCRRVLDSEISNSNEYLI